MDKCVDRRLAREIADHDVQTVPQMGWAGIKDGQLLVLAAASFDVLITSDRNLSFQQNLSQFDIAVIVLQAFSNRLDDLKPLVPGILTVLDTALAGQATVVRLEPT